MKFIDLTGQHFGRLTVIRRTTNQGTKIMWECLCNGSANVPHSPRTVIIRGDHLKNSSIKSCGCLFDDVMTIHGHTKGGTKSPEFCAWDDMLSRCYNPNHTEYHNYGGRKPPESPITVCDNWRYSFVNYNTYLTTILGPRPSPQHTPDRIDNNGNYEPGNLRWATKKEQARNKRNNVLLTYNGQTMCISAWAEFLNIPVITLYIRIYRGWSVEEALSIPIGQARKLKP